MQCFTVKRSQNLTAVPEIYREQIKFELGSDESEASNAAFHESKQLEGDPATKRRSDEACLRAQRLASHLRMPEIMQFVPLQAALAARDADENMQANFTINQKEAYSRWFHELSQGQNWKSSRIFHSR